MGDYYETLGVGRSATAEEIKSKYRRLAMKYHPDRNPGDKAAEEQFKRITEAYEVLGDERRRREYDMLGQSGPSGASGSWGGRGAASWGGQGGQGGFEDIFRGAGFGDGFRGAGFGPFGEETRGGDPFSQWADSGTRFYYYTTSRPNPPPRPTRQDALAGVAANVITAVAGFLLWNVLGFGAFGLFGIIGIILFFKGVFGTLTSLRKLI